MAFSFKAVDEALLESTRYSWYRQLEEGDDDLPASRFLTVIDGAEKCLSGDRAAAGLGESAFFAVVDDRYPEYARAIVEVTYAVRHRTAPGQRWLKVLTIRLEPNLDAGEKPGSIRDMAGALAEILTGALKLSDGQMDADTIKVWCERDEDAAFLEVVSIFVDRDDGELLSFEKEGRWLRITTG